MAPGLCKALCARRAGSGAFPALGEQGGRKQGFPGFPLSLQDTESRRIQRRRPASARAPRGHRPGAVWLGPLSGMRGDAAGSAGRRAGRGRCFQPPSASSWGRWRPHQRAESKPWGGSPSQTGPARSLSGRSTLSVANPGHDRSRSRHRCPAPEPSAAGAHARARALAGPPGRCDAAPATPQPHGPSIRPASSSRSAARVYICVHVS